MYISSVTAEKHHYSHYHTAERMTSSTLMQKTFSVKRPFLFMAPATFPRNTCQKDEALGNISKAKNIGNYFQSGGPADSFPSLNALNLSPCLWHTWRDGFGPLWGAVP